MRQYRSGFTLPEVISVLAVIGVLVSISTPMILNVQRNTRISSFIENTYAWRTAAISHYGDTGRMPLFDSATPNASGLITNASELQGWAGPYLTEPLTNPFDKNGYVGLIVANGANGEYSFDLDGDGSMDIDDALVLMVENVSEREARKLSEIMDGDAEQTAGTGAWFARGRVKWRGVASDDRRYLLIHLANPG
ncbi:MAG: type II secretion system protein [Pseudomonadota bacterium]